MTTTLFDFFSKVISKLIKVSTITENYKNQNIEKKFTIRYTKEELDKIQNDFLQQLSSYF